MTKKAGKRKSTMDPLNPDWVKGLVEIKKSWVAQANLAAPKSPGGWAKVIVCHGIQLAALKKDLMDVLSPWDLKDLEGNEATVLRYTTADGPLWLLQIPTLPKKSPNHQGYLETSVYTQARDLAGLVSTLVQDQKVKGLHIDFVDWEEEIALGLLTGLEVATYRFQHVVNGRWSQAGKPLALTRKKGKVTTKLVEKAGHMAAAINLARHLVNLPANWLHPESYAQAMIEVFRGEKNVKVEVWDEPRLQKEKMGLLEGVGKGAEFGPCLVHVSYRPSGGSKKGRVKPYAFVGKGITFDSGGLDLKPASAMRLMKKDMGGSAAVAGLAVWAVLSQVNKPCDFYLSLAENAVSGSAFRPGDVLKGRNGKLVEIHNTDAEGRLVLADALDVAVHPPNGDKPRVVVDVSTLTGAIKAGLGLEVAGLFSNDDSVAEGIQRASQKRGDLCWRMPLVQSYHRALSTPFGDRMNCTEGYGGAVTAALFLETYVGDVPWAHLDIYAWQDRSEGALTEPGGSGQMVQCLAEWLS
ncbi:MAG: leucyl aminopeptidase family protein [Bdellovibrionaceae bacterium]|nr:leucyl aminopeptidase family protein [Bdellovibrionales bacterium]MCB9082758.1 leucyl aminopeptidase family protein [Pseudobdellovibrionaceae bacterium]